MSADVVTIGLLIVLEVLLSADNALVMALIVYQLPTEWHGRALTYGLAGAFVLRIAATLLATMLIQAAWIRLLGGLYLLFLAAQHFLRSDRNAPEAADHRTSAFWRTIIRLEVTNLTFSVDSILVAVAMSPKRWVVLAGGLLGVAAMRLVAARMVVILRRWPALGDGAFVIIAWVGARLILDYAHQVGWIAWEVPQPVSLSITAGVLLLTIVFAWWTRPPTGESA